MRSLPVAAAACAVLSGAAARAQVAPEWADQGELALEGRVFRGDGDPATKDQALGLFGRLELQHERGPLRERFRAFGRMDAFDKNRSTLIFQEAFVQAQNERFRLRVGLDIVNWTATEAFHPADVINARNLDSDVENFEKIGEPMVSLQARVLENTTVTAFYMPVYVSPRFTSPSSRLHFGLPGVPTPPVLRANRDGVITDADFGHQAAVLVRQVVSGADIAVHAIEQMDRAQPLVVLDASSGVPMPFLLFQTVRQLGGTYQQVLGPLIVKLEGAYRHFVALQDPAAFGGLPNRDHGALALGLEYGIPHAGGKESTLLLEGQAIVGVEDKQLRLLLTPFQRDVLGAYRLAFNDEASSELLAGVIVDLEDPREYLVNLSYQRRLGETWTVRAGLRIFQAPAPGPMEPPTGLQILRNADHLRLILSRNF